MANDIVSTSAKGLSAVVVEAYQDIAQPSARQVGLSLEALTKIVLSPVDLLNFGFQQSKEWLSAKIAARMSRTPEEYRVQPNDNIRLAALSHIAQSNDTPELRDLYAELLLKAMDTRTSDSVHPAYFHLVEQLASKEALVLVGLHELNREALFREEITPYSSSIGNSGELSLEEQFASFCTSVLSPALSQPEIWLTNLCRLGLLTLQSVGEAIFREAENNRHGYRPPAVDNHEHRILEFTPFGRAFISACAPLASSPETPPETAKALD